jgi:SAM-dependent methyltransferase
MSATEPPEPPVGEHWFEPIAEHLGSAYLRYSFTKGTEQEVDFLIEALGLVAGASRVLDVGCGPGRHSHALARRGISVHGIDISQRFIDIAMAGAPSGATFERLDARALPFDGSFDAAFTLCQGAFGLVLGPGEDLAVLQGMERAVRRGGLVAVGAFSSYFQVRLPGTDASTFDAATGINHERTEVRDESGRVAEVDLWTHCLTPRELRELAVRAGLQPLAVWSVEPGAYAARPPTIDTPELLVLARRPSSGDA